MTKLLRLAALVVLVNRPILPAPPGQGNELFKGTVEVVQCVALGMDGTTQTITGPLTTNCPSAWMKVSCDFRASEPLDVSPAQVCAAGPQALVPAKAAKVDRTLWGNRPTNVQWLSPRADGSLAVSAERALSSTSVMSTVLAGWIPGTLLRFITPGVAPHSVAAMPTDRSIRLPDPVGGGELAVRVQDAAITPKEIIVTGPNGIPLELPLGGRFVAVRGALHGQWIVTPRFAGGLMGPPMSTRVLAGASADVFLPAFDVGGLTATLEESLCGRANRVRVASEVKVVSAESIHVRTDVIVDRPMPEGCRLEVEGLAPGNYRVDVLDRDGRLAVAPVEVSAQVTSTVVLATAVAQVSGQVSLGKKPISGVTVEFSPVGEGMGSDHQIASVTDSAGFYRLTAGRPGAFHVRFSNDRITLMGQERISELFEGWNEANWSLTGGVITVNVLGWDRSSDLLLSISGGNMGPLAAQGARLLSQTRVIDRARSLPIRLFGMGWGDYRLSARQRRSGLGDKLSVKVAASVGEQTPASEVTLDLTENSAVLRVIDERGAPVSARVVAGDGPLAELEPGLFSLSSTHPGTDLTVEAPGFVPACRITPPSGTLTVTLDTGRRAEVEFSAGMASGVPEALLFPSGSDCPVFLWALPYQAIGKDDVGATRFSMGTFPIAGTLQMLRDAGSARVTIPAEGPILLPVRRDK